MPSHHHEDDLDGDGAEDCDAEHGPDITERHHHAGGDASLAFPAPGAENEAHVGGHEEPYRKAVDGQRRRPSPSIPAR